MTSNHIASIITASAITVFTDGKVYTVSSKVPEAPAIVKALDSGDTVELKRLLDKASTINKFGSGVGVECRDGNVYFNGKIVGGGLADRIIKMATMGMDNTPLKNFLTNLMENPSRKSIDELYGFLEANNLPITPDGFFLAYKRVKADYKDVYSNTFDNSPGKVLEMPRSDVDDRSEKTCSKGFHVASFEYLRHYSGDKVVLCKVNPKDVVSVPTDYDNSKMRVCKYEVLSDITDTVDFMNKDSVRDIEDSPVYSTEDESDSPSVNDLYFSHWECDNCGSSGNGEDVFSCPKCGGTVGKFYTL